MTRIVLDASAVLALLQGEPGADVVRDALTTGARGTIGAVNLAEVITKLIDKGWAPQIAAQALDDLPCDVLSMDRAAAIQAGMLHARLRRRDISLADSFCIALAAAEQVPVLTADRAWATLGLDVEVQLIR